MRFLTGLILTVLFVVVAMVFLSGCGKDKFIGKWELTEITYMGKTIQAPAGKQSIIEIAKEKDGYYVLDNEKKEKVKASAEGGKLLVREKNNDGSEVTTTFAVDATDILAIDMASGGQTMSMKCKRQPQK